MAQWWEQQPKPQQKPINSLLPQPPQPAGGNSYLADAMRLYQQMRDQAQSRPNPALMEAPPPTPPAPVAQEKPAFDLGNVGTALWEGATEQFVPGLKSAVAQAYTGLDRPDTNPEWATRWMTEGRQAQEQAQARNAELQRTGKSDSASEAIREAIPSLGFSLASMGAAIPSSLAAGAATQAAIPIPGSGVVGGMLGAGAASGVAGYRMAGSQFLNDAFAQLESESQKTRGRSLTEQEKQKAYESLKPIAENTGLWEAGPEAVGNMAMLGLGRVALGLMPKAAMQNIAASALGRVGTRAAAGAGALGTEVATEGVTQFHQGNDQQKSQAVVDALLSGGDVNQAVAAVNPQYQGFEGLVQATKDVAPATIATVLLMGGMAKPAHMAYSAIQQRQEGNARVDQATQASADLRAHLDMAREEDISQVLTAYDQIEQAGNLPKAALERLNQARQQLQDELVLRTSPEALAEPLTTARGQAGYQGLAERAHELSDEQLQEAAQRPLPEDAPDTWKQAQQRYANEVQHRQDLAQAVDHFQRNPDAVKGVSKVLRDIVEGKPLAKGAHGSKDYNLASLSDDVLSRYRLAAEVLLRDHADTAGDLKGVADTLHQEADRRAQGQRRSAGAVREADIAAKIATLPDKKLQGVLKGLSPEAITRMADALQPRVELEPNLGPRVEKLREVAAERKAPQEQPRKAGTGTQAAPVPTVAEVTGTPGQFLTDSINDLTQQSLNDQSSEAQEAQSKKSVEAQEAQRQNQRRTLRPETEPTPAIPQGFPQGQSQSSGLVRPGEELRRLIDNNQSLRGNALSLFGNNQNRSSLPAPNAQQSSSISPQSLTNLLNQPSTASAVPSAPFRAEGGIAAPTIQSPKENAKQNAVQTQAKPPLETQAQPIPATQEKAKASQEKAKASQVVENGEVAGNASQDVIATPKQDAVKAKQGWNLFSKESGTLGIPRAKMPQIKAEHRGAMVNFLNARGVQHESKEIPAKTLKPTQAEFSPKKVRQAKEYQGGNRSILVSKDGYVLDGHHQWMAAVQNNESVPVIVLDAPIKKLLQDVKKFPSAKTDNTTRSNSTPTPETAPHEKGQTEAEATALLEGKKGQGTPTHTTPEGETETATPAVVEDALESSVSSYRLPNKKQSTIIAEHYQAVLKQIDEAIKAAPDVQEPYVPKNPPPTPPKGAPPNRVNTPQFAPGEIVTIEVPGDGVFKIQNRKAALKEFRDKVEKSAAFKRGKVSDTKSKPESFKKSQSKASTTILEMTKDKTGNHAEHVANAWNLALASNEPVIVSPVKKFLEKGKINKDSIPILYVNAQPVDKAAYPFLEGINAVVAQRGILGSAASWDVIDADTGTLVYGGEKTPQSALDALTKVFNEKFKGDVKAFNERLKGKYKKILNDDSASLGVKPTPAAVKAGIEARMQEWADAVQGVEEETKPAETKKTEPPAPKKKPTTPAKSNQRFATPLAESASSEPQYSSDEIPADKANARAYRAAARVAAQSRYAGKEPVSVTVQSTQESVLVGWTGIKHALHYGLPTWKKSLITLHVEELLQRATKVSIEPDRQGRIDPIAVHRYQTTVSLDGQMHEVLLVVREHTDGKRYYDHSVIEPKTPAGLSESSTLKASIEPTPPFTGAKSSITPLADALKEIAGNETVQALIDAGSLRLVAKQSQLPSRIKIPAGQRVAGAVDPETGQVYLIAENIAPGEIEGFLRHEVGVHQERLGLSQRKTRGMRLAHALARLVGARQILGEPSFNDVLAQLERMRKVSRPVQAAFKAAERAMANLEQNPALLREEALSYLVQNHPELSLVKRIIAAVRAFLYKAGLRVHLTENDLRALAVSALRGASRRTLPGKTAVSKGVMAGNADIRYAATSIGQQQPNLTADELLAKIEAGEVTDLSPEQWAQVQAAFLKESVKPAAGNTLTDWFGKSKIKGKDGKPLKMFHGTTRAFTQFDATQAGSNTTHPTSALGFFFTNDKAHAAAKYGGEVLEVYLAIEKPYQMTDADLRGINGAEDAKAFRQKLEKQGYDGVILPRETRTVYVAAFRPDQVKLTTNETFTRGEPDMRFAQANPRQNGNNPQRAREVMDDIGGVRSELRAGERLAANASPKNWLQALKDAKENRRPAWLGLLTRNMQLELAREVLPKSMVKQFAEAGEKIDADESRMIQAEAFPLAERWQNLMRKARGQADALSKMLYLSTWTGIDPRQPAPTGKRAEWLRAKSAFDALTPEAQTLYGDVLAFYQGQTQRLFKTLQERIDRHSLPAKDRLAAKDLLRQEFERMKQDGPYVPLMRFGDLTVYAEPRNPNEKPVFATFESVQEQRAFADWLTKEGYDPQLGVKMEELAKRQLPQGDFIDKMAGIIDKTTKGPESQALKDAMYQLFLRSLPEQAIRRHFIHRRFVPGYSADALRSFATFARRSSKQIARLAHGDIMGDALDQMAKAARSGPVADRVAAGHLVNELEKSFQWAMNPTTATWSSRLTNLGFLWHLGASPAHLFLNLSQQAQVTAPWLAGEFKGKRNFGSVTAALLKANKDFLATRPFFGARTAAAHQARAKLDAEFGGDLGRALHALEEAGKTDKTQTYSLAGLSEEDNFLWSRPYLRKLTQGAAWFFHIAEVQNREASAIAAYRLARASEMTHEQAYDMARRVIDETHFDYSPSNRARFMRSNPAKVLTLFKQYSLNISWQLGRNAYLATRGASPAVKAQARTKLLGMLGMTFLMAGAAGMPFYNEVMWLLTQLMNAARDDDEPEMDADLEFRKLLGSLGETGSEAVRHGLANAFMGVDVSSRVKLDDLWWRQSDQDLEGRQVAYHAMENLLGPVAGLAVRGISTTDGLIRGLSGLSARGDTGRALEGALPKTLRDIARSIRFNTEGATSFQGATLIPASQFGAAESVGQLLGFTPAALADKYEVNRDRSNLQRRIESRRRAMLDTFAMAYQNHDDAVMEAVKEDVRDFNRRYPSYAITGATVRQSLRARLRAQAEVEAMGGVRLNKKLLGVLE